MHTQSIEDYLKTIYTIQQEQGQVTTTMLAERLKVAPASATNMIKKLAGMKLAAYEPYHGLTLTEAGQKLALKILRQHRLVELYLAEALGVSWAQAHAEAEKWEHVLSEEMEDRLAALLGHPTVNPQGEPIPTREETITEVI